MGNLAKLALGATLLAGATLAFAHENHKGDTSETIIIKRIHGEPGKHRADRADHVMIAKCDGAPDVDVSDESKDGDKVRRSRVVICNKGAMGPHVVEALERARERLATQDELSAETRAKALAAIDAAIARHRDAK